jgi:hypothetical protein
MKQFQIWFLLVAACWTGSASAQSFSVSFPQETSSKPLDGRLLLLLSTDDSAEPRMQIDDTPKSQMIFGITVDAMKPGTAVTVDDRAAGYPILHLKDVSTRRVYGAGGAESV